MRRLARSRRIAWGALAVTLAAAVLGACRQTIGIDQYFNAPADAGSSVCGLSYGTPTCASCASARCCSESIACAADRTCAPYESCLGDCKGDPKCRTQCAIDHPVGTATDVSALSVCLANKCEDECELSCGALAGWQVEPDAASACQACIAANACSVVRDCARSIDCDATNRCILACPTLDCKEACETQHGLTIDYGDQFDAGTAPWPALQKVATGVCASACNTGGYWECVNKVSWPAPKTATSTIHFWFKDEVSGSGVPGTTVSVCSSTDVDCNSAVVTGMTNDAGEVLLSFANRGVFSNGLGLTGYLKTAPSMNELPGPVFWGFPLSESDFFAFGTGVTPQLFQQAIMNANITLDANRSALNGVVFDCLGNYASGVNLTVDTADEETVAINLSGNRTVTTDSTGILSFFNVPTGPVRITATPVAIGRPSAQVVANVQGAAGIGGPTVYLPPTPMP
jgi:hypothetical protein